MCIYHRGKWRTDKTVFRLLSSFFPGSTLVFPWFFIGFSLVLTRSVLPWFFIGSYLVLPWFFPGSSLDLHWIFPGISLVIPWIFTGSSLVHPWFYFGSNSVLPWFFLDVYSRMTTYRAIFYQLNQSVLG